MLQKYLIVTLSAIFLNASHAYALDDETPVCNAPKSWDISSTTTQLLIITNNNCTFDYFVMHPGQPPKELEILGSWHPLVDEQPDECPVFLLENSLDISNEYMQYLYHTCDQFANLHKYPITEEFILKTMAQPQETKLLNTEDLSQILTESDNIIFFEGAGLSAKKVQTLVQFHNQLGLQGLPGIFAVTNKSLINFIELLLKNPEHYHATITNFFSSFGQSDPIPTEAHYALKEIVEILKNRGKQVIIHSGNFDGFLEAVGLERVMGNEIIDTSKLTSLTIVVLGLRVDNGGILNKYKNRLPETKIFSLNMKPEKFLEVDPDNLKPLETLMNIDGHILGDLQQTMPQLKDRLTKIKD